MITTSKISDNKRPKILLEAAHICAKSYRRETLFPHMLGASSAQVLAILKEQEHGQEMTRRAIEGTYSAQSHIMVLSAVIAESRNVC